MDSSEERAMSTRYTVLMYPDDDAYSVVVPALPGCVTWGSTLDEAVNSAREAIEGHVAALRDTGQEVPEEGSSPMVMTIELVAPTSVPA
jgi:antitoxin HicB